MYILLVNWTVNRLCRCISKV